MKNYCFNLFIFSKNFFQFFRKTISISDLPIIDSINYFNLDYKLEDLKTITFYNDKLKKLLSYSKENDKKEKKDFSIKYINNNNLVIAEESITSKPFTKIDKLILYDIDKGKSLTDIVYSKTNKSSTEFYFPLVEIKNDKILVIGEIKKYNGSVKNLQNPSLGINRAIYNYKGEELLNNKTIYYEDIFNDLNFKNGKDDKNYKFLVTDYFNFNDNSFSILLEKQKGDNKYTSIRTTDYILVNFNKLGEFTNYKVIEKSKDFYESYIFSQENKDSDEVLFFYSEEVKEFTKKSYNLVINKLKDGNVTQTRMPFKTESSYLRFSKAQYGYILISEYNKDDKETSIRIEKINF